MNNQVLLPYKGASGPSNGKETGYEENMYGVLFFILLLRWGPGIQILS